MARAAKAKKEVEVSLETVLWNCRVALQQKKIVMQ